MDTVRRQFIRGLTATLAFPAAAIAGTWDSLGCICRKIGAHWTICRQHWKDSSDADFRKHLCATHGHKPYELADLPRDGLLKLHDVHHEGGSFRSSYLWVRSVPKPSAGRILKGKS